MLTRTPFLSTFHQPCFVRAGPGALPFGQTSAEMGKVRGLAFKGRTALATQREMTTFSYLVSSPRAFCRVFASVLYAR